MAGTATILFGLGQAAAVRTDVANSTPVIFDIAQELQIDMDQAVKRLVGQNKYAVDIAQAEQTVKGKVKFASARLHNMNDLLLGQSGGTTPASGQLITGPLPEQQTVTTGAATATHASAWVQDLGVRYHATGIQLTRVANTPALGQYAVTAGVYTFNTGDNAQVVDLLYRYTVTTALELVINNQLMGVGPLFQFNYGFYYINNGGGVMQGSVVLNSCRGSKLSLPTKNVDYMVQDFEFEASADQSGTVAIITMPE